MLYFQYALLLPVLVHHIRYHMCLHSLDEKMGYVFKDRASLQVNDMANQNKNCSINFQPIKNKTQSNLGLNYARFPCSWHQLFQYFLTWDRLHTFLCLTRVFPRLPPTECVVFFCLFVATSYMYVFSRTWHQLHAAFPRLAPAALLPALNTSCIFSRAWQETHIGTLRSNYLITVAVIGQM